MERIAMETVNITDKNIEKIIELFPNVATESRDENGKIKRVIDFDKLKQELSDNIIDNQESYDFTWVGKKEAMLEANRPIRKTLRPQKERSVNWETTENIYIEGDNLDALKLLQESYLGKVKIIYIDPPYNTGNDFVYRDNFTRDKDSYEEEIGIKDEQGNKLFKNSESNGRFHSDWCSMIYPRLKLARNLLSDDGVIFISIDANEVNNMSKIGNEIFGSSNCIGIISTINNLKGRSDDKYFATCNEFLLVYCKNKDNFNIKGFKLDEEELEKDYDKQDEISFYKLIGFRKTGSSWERIYRPYMFYPVLYKDNSFSTVTDEEFKKIYNPKTNSFDDVYLKELVKKYEDLGYKVTLPTNEKGEYGRWRWGKDTFYEQKDYNLEFNNAQTLCTKMRATLEDGSLRVKTAKTLWYKPEYDTGSGAKILKTLFENSSDIFENPKSIIYIKDILKIASEKDSIVLDFFSGSATTAHATMQLNAEDNGNRKFILVQLPEITGESTQAYMEKYMTICDIGEERIRRAGKKIQAENSDKKIDIGFRVFKVDDTNMKEVYYSPKNINQGQLGMFESNIKEDRNDEDLLYEVLLNNGVELSLPHKVEEIEGKKVHIIQSIYSSTPDIIACLEKSLSDSLVKKIAEKKPSKVVFRDCSFVSDANKINVEEIFKLITPDTRVKVL